MGDPPFHFAVAVIVPPTPNCPLTDGATVMFGTARARAGNAGRS
jgi:hypothetical protein